MRTFLRILGEQRGLWRLALPLVALAAIMPCIALATPLVERYLIDNVLLARRLDRLPAAGALYGGLWLLGMTLQIPAATLSAWLTERATMRLRQRLFAHCEVLSVAFARREHSGRTAALFNNDAQAIGAFVGGFITTWIGNLASLVLGIAVMYRLQPQLALAAGILPLVAGGIGAVATRPLRSATRRVHEKAAELSERLQEHLAGLREVVAFGQGAQQGARHSATMEELSRLRLRVLARDKALQSGQMFLSMAVLLVIFMYGGYLVIQGRTSIGTLVAMRALFAQVLYPAGQLLGLLSGVQKALGAADRIYGFLDERPAVEDRSTGPMQGATSGAVAFEGVGFAYTSGREVIRDVSFVAPPGSLTAIVGPSGAGKSTLAGLIARFHDPAVGRVLLDGTDLRDLPLADLRSQIAFVFQDTFLFAGTVRENIAFGRPGASEEAVIAAARAAHAWEFIERLPNGLDTPVGERGTRLSEGQKQRLAIARALVRDPRILILDEPTAALDARSEHLLQAALDNLTRGRTTFVIAHRLATVRRADRILVLDRGLLAEQGTHHNLLARRGLYRTLHDLQFDLVPDAGPAESPDAEDRPDTVQVRSPLRALPIAGA